MLFACYLWSFTVPYNFNNVPNKCLPEKISCRERLRCKVWPCLWEFALGYSAHLLDCGHLFSEGVYTDQSPICIGLLHANMDLVSPNKSDCWHTRTLTIWTPETMARKYGWGKYYASLCNQFNFSFFGSCHLFIGTMTGKLLQLSPSVLLKEIYPI